MKAPHRAQFSIQFTERHATEVMESLARKLYVIASNNPNFPYDEDEKRSEDKRKILGAPWHLKYTGQAFVGQNLVAGRMDAGPAPKLRSKKAVSIIFTNPKEVKKGKKYYRGSDGAKLFDYAEFVLEPFILAGNLITENDIDNALSEAIDEWLKTQ